MRWTQLFSCTKELLPYHAYCSLICVIRTHIKYDTFNFEDVPLLRHLPTLCVLREGFSFLEHGPRILTTLVYQLLEYVISYLSTLFASHVLFVRNSLMQNYMNCLVEGLQQITRSLQNRKKKSLLKSKWGNCMDVIFTWICLDIRVLIVFHFWLCIMYLWRIKKLLMTIQYSHLKNLIHSWYFPIPRKISSYVFMGMHDFLILMLKNIAIHFFNLWCCAFLYPFWSYRHYTFFCLWSLNFLVWDC